MRRWGRVTAKRRMLDLEEVEAALKRAAWIGLRGTAEERSGRFRPLGERGGGEKMRGAERGEPGADRGKK